MNPAPLVCLLLLALACPAQARIYMYIDADGRKGATDSRAAIPAGAKITSVIEDGNAEPGAARKPGRSSARTPTPANFPRIDSDTQKKRDDVRMTVLQEELARERKNLDEAKHQLALGEKPLAGENATSPSYQNRVKQLQGAVDRHQRNVSAIQKEIGTIR